MIRRPLPLYDGVSASRLQLPPGPWRTVLEALCARFPQIPRSTWESRFARGRVLAADEVTPLAMDAAYRVGLEVAYYREVEEEPIVAAVERIVHIDAHLVVADKPHGLPVVPAGGFVRQTLLHRLIERLDNPHLVPLHRIDRATAGLVLFSAEPGTRAAYHALFREGRIDKSYEALAPPLPHLTFPYVHRSRIERGVPFFRMRECAGALNSETRIDVRERMPDCWRYRLEPVTGRKHQLRVHLAALGAPILHDPWYPELREADDHAPMLQLLAASLAFEDPLDGRRRRFDSQLRLQP
ncbi:pseudouridine synthase [Luteimonas sp. gir]|uniref:pseudouridine synthase n=1 Tax=Luteimonas sp. gir TaxID=3127960 RepID=UPI003075E0E6